MELHSEAISWGADCELCHAYSIQVSEFFFRIFVIFSGAKPTGESGGECFKFLHKTRILTKRFQFGPRVSE